jgi:hypothetical protein
LNATAIMDNVGGDFRNQKQYGRPCTKVGGRPCVALRTPSQLCKIVSAQPKLRPARQSGHWTTNRGRTIIPRCLCSSCQRQILHHSSRLNSNSLWCRYGTASGEPASMTDQQRALESAGLYGQVESGRPSLPSSLEKVCGGIPVDSRGS